MSFLIYAAERTREIDDNDNDDRRLLGLERKKKLYENGM